MFQKESLSDIIFMKRVVVYIKWYSLILMIKILKAGILEDGAYFCSCTLVLQVRQDIV